MEIAEIKEIARKRPFFLNRLSLDCKDIVINTVNEAFNRNYKTDDKIEVRIVSTLGTFDDVIDTEKSGKDVKMGFNPKLMADALKVIDEETVSLYIVNSKAPCFIRDDEGKYIYLVLPVNTR